jgi:hypothetical protein
MEGTMPDIDLTAIPVIDNHCHPLVTEFTAQDGPAPDLLRWRRRFTEAADPEMARTHVPQSVPYRWLLREVAAFLGCVPEEAAVLAERAGRGGSTVSIALLRDARFAALLVDEGYPPPAEVVPRARLAELAGCRVAPLLRLEVLMQRLVSELPTLAQVEDALRAELLDIRAAGYVGLKSIVAYRTGLRVREWPREEALAAFATAREIVARTGALRIAQQPLLDTLLHVAFAAAAQQEAPVQFHCGYGDPDIDLLLGNPLHLRAVLERPEYRGMPVILLHECYPYIREGAYLAAVHPNVSLDLSYGIPFLDYGELLQMTRAALGVAPASKLLYSSDGVGVAELHWASAQRGRRILGRALGELVGQGILATHEAEAMGAAILRDNARRMYGV